jgi:hypothetical protein
MEASMIHDVVSATYKGEYRIKITFDDGKSGIVDFSPYIERGGIFERLRDLNVFRNFEINEDLGVLTWEGDIDVAPETLYAEATGTPLPDWMTEAPATSGTSSTRDRRG